MDSTASVTVPDIVGLTMMQAAQSIGGAGLVLTEALEVEPVSRRSPTVTWQQPEAGTLLRRQGTVTAGHGARGDGRSGDREPRVPLPTVRVDAAPRPSGEDTG